MSCRRQTNDSNVRLRHLGLRPLSLHAFDQAARAREYTIRVEDTMHLARTESSTLSTPTKSVEPSEARLDVQNFVTSRPRQIDKGESGDVIAVGRVILIYAEF